ncbi:glycoside hydrolase domain-containing protein, partial [Actinomadura fibrosa]|uniref:glycoside hydrolase domain-containing protein n=1 Tax=Actinomadura fibrosa TaxID=111802 RepID=UPI0013F174BC
MIRSPGTRRRRRQSTSASSGAPAASSARTPSARPSASGGGEADARDAAAQAAWCGMPDDRPIYFAVDWDAT